MEFCRTLQLASPCYGPKARKDYFQVLVSGHWVQLTHKQYVLRRLYICIGEVAHLEKRMTEEKTYVSDIFRHLSASLVKELVSSYHLQHDGTIFSFFLIQPLLHLLLVIDLLIRSDSTTLHSQRRNRCYFGNIYFSLRHCTQTFLIFNLSRKWGDSAHIQLLFGGLR